MKNRRLGNKDLYLSELGVGLWSIITDWWGADVNKAEEILRKAFELGINFYDTADSYAEGKGEEILGKVFKTKRDKIVILTKIGIDFYHREGPRSKLNFEIDYLEFAFRQSLRRLDTDYVDILLLHNPKMTNIIDSKIFEFMRSLKKDGYARYIGVALGPTLGWGEEGLEAIRMGYEVLEYIYNLIEREPGETFLKYSNIGHIVRVPHANDILYPSKWDKIFEEKSHHRSLKDNNWLKLALDSTRELYEFCKRMNIDLAQLAIQFILHNKNVTSVVPNITSIKELEYFVKSVEKEIINNEIINYLNEYYYKYYKDLNEMSIKETLKYK
ncbi:MAG: aldo/keto reductase [Sulfolobaceae archaeon]